MEKNKILYEADIEFFQQRLQDWFTQNGRNFPWRSESATNYELIISEIFLQRTKAETVANFLPNFLEQYSSWYELGNASEYDLQNVLTPLGLYKQRGSRLFKLAQEIKARKGEFPNDRNEVQEMSMMGQYLTNAYELYILNKKSPLLDVNMTRVLERFFGNRKLSDIRHDPYLQTLSYRVVNVDNSKQLNWAILDFASAICKSRRPKCNECVISSKCKYYAVNKNL